MFMIACYSGAGFCFSWAVINVWSNNLHPPEGVSPWVPLAFAGVAVLMAAFGTWLVLGPARIIKTITAIPKNIGDISNAVGKAATPELQIEVELKKMFPLPFFPARKIYVKPEEIVLRHPLAQPSKGLTAADVRAAQIEKEREKQKFLEWKNNHLLTLPFRQMSQGFFKLFKMVGRSWHREGFMKVVVGGASYKLDTTGGWALDGGRALDRIATLKPSI